MAQKVLINRAIPPPFFGPDLQAFITVTEICTDPLQHPLRAAIVAPPEEDSFGQVGRDGHKTRWRSSGRLAKPTPLWGLDEKLRDLVQNSIDAIRLAMCHAGIRKFTLHTAATPPGKGWKHSKLVLACIPEGKPFVVAWWGVREYESDSEATHLEIGNIGLMSQRSFITGESAKSEASARGLDGEPLTIGMHGSGLKDIIAAHLGEGGAISFDNASSTTPDAWNVWNYATSIHDDGVVRISFNGRKAGEKPKHIHAAASTFGLTNFVVTRVVIPLPVVAVTASLEKNTVFAADMHTRPAAELNAPANNGACINAGDATYTSLSRNEKWLLGTVTFPSTYGQLKASQFNVTLGGVYLTTVHALTQFSFGVATQATSKTKMGPHAALTLARDRKVDADNVGRALAEVWEGALRTHAVRAKFVAFIEQYVKDDMMGAQHMSTVEAIALRQAGQHSGYYPMINALIAKLYADTIIERRVDHTDEIEKKVTAKMCAAVSDKLPLEHRFETNLVFLENDAYFTLIAFLNNAALPFPTLKELVTKACKKATFFGTDITEKERTTRLPWFPLGSPVRFVEFDVDIALFAEASSSFVHKTVFVLYGNNTILQSKQAHASPETLFGVGVAVFPTLRKSLFGKLEVSHNPSADAGAGGLKRNAAEDDDVVVVDDPPPPSKRTKSVEVSCPGCKCALDVAANVDFVLTMR